MCIVFSENSSQKEENRGSERTQDLPRSHRSEARAGIPRLGTQLILPPSGQNQLGKRREGPRVTTFAPRGQACCPLPRLNRGDTVIS